MSRTLEISDELYSRLEAEARRKGLESVERFLETNFSTVDEEAKREEWFRKVDELREHLYQKYGKMPDSVDLIREDRER